MTPDEPITRQQLEDTRTSAMIQAAHVCESLPNIDDCLPYRNFGDMWASLARQWPDRRWLAYYPCREVDENPEWFTFGRFSELVDRVAILLAREYRISAGCTIATMTVSQAFTAALYFAAWRLGARVVPINPRWPDQRVADIVAGAEAILLVLHTATREDLEPLDAVLDEDMQRTLILDGTHRNGALAAEWDDFNAALDEVDLSGTVPPVPDVHWDTDALVVHMVAAVGTGVVLTQKQLFAGAYGVTQWHGINERGVLMTALPLPDVDGMMMSLIAPAFVGAQVVVNRTFRARGFWQKVARHNVEIVSLAPPLLEKLLETGEEIDRGAMPNFRHFICGGGPLSTDLIRSAQEQLGLKIVYGHHRNETAGYTSFVPADLDWHEHARWMYGQEEPSIGMPIAVNEMAVHDAQGMPIPDGEKGEVVVRGHNVMSGYLNNPAASARAFAHGWFRTGDEGMRIRGEDGRTYYIVTEHSNAEA